MVVAGRAVGAGRWEVRVEGRVVRGGRLSA